MHTIGAVLTMDGSGGEGTWDKISRTFLDWQQAKAVLPDILKTGVPNTLLISAAAVAVGFVIGMLLAVMLVSRRIAVRAPARAYVDVFRGLPVTVTVLLIGIGLPIAGVKPFGREAFGYAVLALGLIAGAYTAEILRSGIQSVDKGQLEAARSLGMPYLTAMRLIIVPQGVRRVLPALTNEFITIIKSSSLVFLLGLSTGQMDVFSIATIAQTQSGNLTPVVAAGGVYIAITIPLTRLVNAWDRRLREGPQAAAAVEPLTLEGSLV